MIRINSFYFTDNLTRVVYEFYDEKVVIKTKSLMVEQEGEIKYEKIKVIENRRAIDLSWLNAGLAFIIYLGIIPLFFGSYFHANLIIQIVIKGLAILGVTLCIPTFHKSDYCCFLDINRKFLTTIMVSRSDRKILNEAINLIKQKTEIISETRSTDQLPDTSSIYELTQHDIPDYLNKSVTRFYDDRLIDSEKSLREDWVTELKYSELGEKTQILRVGNEKWSTIGCLWLFFITALCMLIFIFSPQPTKGVVFYLFLGGIILSIPMFVFRYIKREALLFFNKNDEVIWLAGPTTTNRKKLEQIVEFVQTKTTSNQKN